MKIQIVRDDSVVGVDGVFRQVDVSDLDGGAEVKTLETNHGGNWHANAPNAGQASGCVRGTA